MGIPQAFIIANFVLAAVATVAAFLALSIWLFVLTNKGRNGQMLVTPAAAHNNEYSRGKEFFTTDKVPENLTTTEKVHSNLNQQIYQVQDNLPIKLDHMEPMMPNKKDEILQKLDASHLNAEALPKKQNPKPPQNPCHGKTGKFIEESTMC